MDDLAILFRQLPDWQKMEERLQAKKAEVVSNMVRGRTNELHDFHRYAGQIEMIDYLLNLPDSHANIKRAEKAKEQEVVH